MMCYRLNHNLKIVKLRHFQIAERDTEDSPQHVHSRHAQEHILGILELHKHFRKVKNSVKNSGVEAETSTTYQAAASTC